MKPTAISVMKMVNDLTPDIKDKAFDPGWFELRQAIEELANATIDEDMDGSVIAIHRNLLEIISEAREIRRRDGVDDMDDLPCRINYILAQSLKANEKFDEYVEARTRKEMA